MKEVKRLIEKFVQEINNSHVTKMYETQNFGKMIRAKLVLKIAGENAPAYKLAAIIESIHFASLLHDDVIDDANTRRGAPSINASFSNKNAIMLGDVFYSKGFHSLLELDTKIAKIVSGAVVSLSKGEIDDVFLGDAFNDDEAAYMDMIYLKTASLIEAACQAASILAGKDEQTYKTYGRTLGLCFQIVDDILDLTQDEHTLGKPAFNDFKEGKTTLPFIYLYRDLGSDDRLKLKSLFKRDLSADEKSWIKAKMNEHSCIERVRKKVIELSCEATSVSPDLKDILDSVINREF